MKINERKERVIKGFGLVTMLKKRTPRDGAREVRSKDQRTHGTNAFDSASKLKPMSRR